MADEGPTTVGSIDAQLDLDMSEWDRKVAKAKADAAELGALHPTADMDANSGPALQRINEVQQATDRLQVSDGKLTEAEKALSTTTDTSSVSRTRHKQATDDDRDSTDRSTRSTQSATQALQGHVSGIGVLIALAPAVLAAAAPVGAAAIGLGAAFGVMAGAGVLAFLGIRNEMEQGTGTGEAYKAGIDQLGDSFTTLEHTSAVAMLAAFNQAGGVMGSYMPFLNQTVGTFSGLLGQMGVTTLRGVLEGLQEMNPLLVTGGAELSKFVSWLFSFTGTNGFTQFIDYAIANLPSVMHFIEGLVTLAGNLIAAFAPLGPALIGGLSMLVDLLNSFPLPVLAGLVTTAVLMAPAFKLAGLAVAVFGTAAEVAGGQVTLFGIAANLAVPVVGILLAAVAGIGMVMATAAVGTQTATSSMAEYVQELQASNGAIDDSIRKTAAKAAVDSGAAAAAQTLGLNAADVTNAILGQGNATQTLQTKIDAIKASYNGSAVSVDDYGRVTHLVTQSQQDQYDTAVKLEKAMQSQSGTFAQAQANQRLYGDALANTNTHADTAAKAEQDLATAAGISADAYQKGISTQQTNATQLQITTAAMYLQNDAAGILKGSLDALNGKSLSAAQAQNAFDSSLANMGDHIDKTGKKITFTTTSIGDMSSASVALRGQLNGQIATLQGVVEANGGLANSTGKAHDQMVTMRQQIIDNAVAHGVDRDAVTAYIDKIMQIPDKVPPTKLDVDDAAAKQKLEDFQQSVNALTGKRVQITTDVITNHVDTGVPDTQHAASRPGIMQFDAAGGLIRHLAGGGWSDITAGGSITGPGSSTSDDVPLMGSAGEFMMKASSVASIGPGTMEYMNRTGQLPPRAGATSSQPVIVNLILDGQIIDTRIIDLAALTANQAIDHQQRQYEGMRR